MNSRFCWLKSIVIGFVGFLCWQTARAQGSPADQKRYMAAVNLVRTGEYDRAKADLNTIIQQRGLFAPYASYYYALAAFRQKNFNQSRLMLRQLMEVFPNWGKMDDAQYLYAAACMEMGQYEDALTAIQKIGNSALRPDIARLEQAFVPRITDLKRLKQLNQSFPSDRTIGLALIDLIQRTASDKDDLELSDRLTNRFGVPGAVASQPTVTPPSGTPPSRPASPSTPDRNTRPKGYYNVAVMFPFRVDEFDSNKRVRSNQYVYDLYDGIKMAKNKLQEEGITVNLFAYDVDNDANKTLELVNSQAFAQTDLIIGPLYIEPNRIASAYANQSNILLLNPIATSSDLVANQPMSFLAQASINQQTRKVAEQVQALGGSRRAAIYYGTARKDSLLAVAYRAELKRQNYQILDFRKMGGPAQAMADAMQFGGTSTPAAAPRPTSTTAPPTGTPAAGIALGHVFLPAVMMMTALVCSMPSADGGISGPANRNRFRI